MSRSEPSGALLQGRRVLVTGGAQVIRLCEGTFGITRREWRILALLAEFDVGDGHGLVVPGEYLEVVITKR